MQAVGLVQPGSPGGRHALDLLETAVDGVPLVLHLGGVEGTAGHQAVCLAVQVLQAILGRGHDGGVRDLEHPRISARKSELGTSSLTGWFKIYSGYSKCGMWTPRILSDQNYFHNNTKT